MEFRRIALATGIELGVLAGGTSDGLPLLFLHGFPESHRTWRHQIAALSQRHPVAAPDQRGYGHSGKPAATENYKPARLAADVLALADALGWDRFVLVGHDWGGAVAWATAIAHPHRLHGLVIVNAPHPYRFQQSLIEDADQRAASQYVTAYRDLQYRAKIERIGLSAWFDHLFGEQFRSGKISAEDREAYLREWSIPGAVDAMLDWYRASPITVPAIDETAALAWLDQPFPPVQVAVQIIWGLDDHALLPLQLSGLADLVPDLRIRRVEHAGHFATWEAPEAVTAAIADFLSELEGG